MTRILLVGDTHGDGRFLEGAVQHAVEQDCTHVFQLGDFGFVWDKNLRPLERVLGLAERYQVEIRWLDGNHENFDMLRGYYEASEAHTWPARLPFTWIERWGEPGAVSHMPRGHVFAEDGVTFGVMGGAFSIDRKYRDLGLSYWEEELITEDDVSRAREATQHVDVMLCHDVPARCWDRDNPMRKWMMERNYKVDPESQTNRHKLGRVYDSWRPLYVYHGHYHHSYEHFVTSTRGGTYVRGLACNGMAGSWHVLDTKTIF